MRVFVRLGADARPDHRRGTDSSGAVVAGANITIANPQTNFTRQVQTNSTGNYVFPTLLPGLYSLRVEMQGFQTEVRNQIELQVAQVARIDFQRM